MKAFGPTEKLIVKRIIAVKGRRFRIPTKQEYRMLKDSYGLGRGW